MSNTAAREWDQMCRAYFANLDADYLAAIGSDDLADHDDRGAHAEVGRLMDAVGYAQPEETRT
jgi:hypothetical protein